jgi:hypothetical protein
MTPEQKRAFKKMTPEQKLKLLANLQISARKLKASGLRMQNPNLTNEEILKKIREIFLYART